MSLDSAICLLRKIASEVRTPDLKSGCSVGTHALDVFNQNGGRVLEESQNVISNYLPGHCVICHSSIVVYNVIIVMYLCPCGHRGMRVAWDEVMHGCSDGCLDERPCVDPFVYDDDESLFTKVSQGVTLFLRVSYLLET